MVLEHPRLCHGTSAEGLVVRIAYDALSVNVVEADVIVRSVVASAHRKVVAVRDASTLHLLLPVSIGSLVAGQREVVGFGVVSEVVGSSQLYVLSHIVYSHISVVADMCRAALAFLRGDDNHAVGCLRSVDGCGCGVAQHVNALNVVSGDE